MTRPDVKRYFIGVFADPSAMSLSSDVREDPSGEWVRWSDMEQLLARPKVTDPDLDAIRERHAKALQKDGTLILVTQVGRDLTYLLELVDAERARANQAEARVMELEGAIRTGHMASIGGVRTHYVPQISRVWLDALLSPTDRAEGDALEASLTAARERIAVLEEALRPFVLWAEYQTAPHASFTIPDPIGDGLAITKEEIDVARRALNPEETK